LIELQGKYSALVVGDDNTVQSKPVTVLDQIGDQAIISEGLKKGDKVVIDAIQKARTGTVVIAQLTEFKSKTSN